MLKNLYKYIWKFCHNSLVFFKDFYIQKDENFVKILKKKGAYLLAEWADERILPRVHHRVPVEVYLRRERLIAIRTCQLLGWRSGLLFRVSVHVTVQIRLPSECLRL